VTTTSPAASTPAAAEDVRSRLKLVLVLGALIALGPLTIDLYLPALPSITDDLQTTSAAVQLTLTGTLVGVAVGQLLIGPLSDALGRRVPLLAGIGVHILASLLCVVAPSVEVLGALRVLQGLGAAAASVTAMAVVRDRYTGVAAATVLSRLMLVLGVAPILAPTLGGEVLRHTDWRGVFVALAFAGVGLMVLAAVALEETHPPERRRPGRLLGTLRTYRGLLRDGVFVGLMLVAGLTMSALFAYVSGSSFVFQEQYGLDQQQFGIVFGLGAVALIGATQLNVRLLRRWSPEQVLTGAVVGGLLAALLLLVTGTSGAGGLVGVLLPVWLVLGAAGLALPNTPALALSRHGESAGSAAALLGATQFGLAAVTAPFVGVLGNDARAMAAVVAVAMAGALIVLLLVVRPRMTST
jgi:DHA1 family bicyclomycin/chloramphenicol resistance-like MFS transporter